MSEPENALDEPGEQSRSACYNAAHDLAKHCYNYRANNPWAQINALDDAINCLMTELWDWTFSQTEIRQAFENALADMDRYTARREKRD